MLPDNRLLEWRAGFRARVDVNKAYDEVQRIKAANGGDATAKDVVKAAKRKSSPLHPQIWHQTDSQAAQAHREQLASQMLCSFVYVNTERPKDEPVRALVVTGYTGPEETSPAANFRNIDEALEDSVWRANLLNQALIDARNYRRKYNALQELAKIITAIEEVTA